MDQDFSHPVGQFIGGAWVRGRADAVSVNPARPTEEVLRYAIADSEDIDAAFDAAQRALRPWGAMPAPERGRIVRRAAQLVESSRDELARLITRDEGKTLAESQGEVSRTIETLNYHAAQCWEPEGHRYASSRHGEELYTVRLPVGVVGVITPFNFPMVIPSWKLGPALVHGNTVVWKPASLCPAPAIALVRIFHDAGVPDGVLNLVLGPGSVGQQVCEHTSVNAITFTGSVPVGRMIESSSAEKRVRCQLELGGHNATVIFPDADIERAAKSAVASSMLGSGQKCTSTRRVIVHESIRDQVVASMFDQMEALAVGDGLDSDTSIGPLISRAAQTHARDGIAAAEAAGARVRTGGRLTDAIRSSDGFYVPPTLLEEVTADMPIAQEELFAPVVSVITFRDDDEALDLANGTRFGLSASVFTSNPLRVRQFVQLLDVGVLHVNGLTTGAEPHVPFGGRRDSAAVQSPPEQGPAAREFFTWTKTVYEEPAVSL